MVAVVVIVVGVKTKAMVAGEAPSRVANWPRKFPAVKSRLTETLPVLVAKPENSGINIIGVL